MDKSITLLLFVLIYIFLFLFYISLETILSNLFASLLN